MVRNVKIGESPEWIKKRLIAAGMRPINNIVDISNFVMLEYGQPTHFFDADKLGKTVLVRDAKDNEKIITLDREERTLSNKDIVITDGIKPICIAGVMGGENTEVDETTKNIFIEAAIFDAFTITKTATRLNLKSEASKRYGKGLNFEYTIEAMNRSLSLLEEYAKGEVLQGEVLHDKIPKTEKQITVTVEELNNVLGLHMTNKDIEQQLDKLDFKYELKENNFHITIPRRRLDVEANKADIAEEIGRLYGYNNLEDTLPNVKTKRGVYKGDVLIRKQITKRLRALGLNEVKTYTLVSEDIANKFRYEQKELLYLPNPMSSDKSVLRLSLIPSLLNVYDYNKARNIKDIAIYEIAKTYDKNYEEDTKVTILIKGNYLENTWNNSKIVNDFYTLKGIIENLLNYLGFENRYQFEASKITDLHPGISAKILIDKKEIGIIGKVHPNTNKDDIYVCELSMTKLYNIKSSKLKYQEISKYPDIVKDVAFIVDKKINSKDIEIEINKNGSKILNNIKVFDLYEGDKIKEGTKSIAYSLTFNNKEKTLNEEEVDKVFRNIIDKVTTKFNCEIRDK